MDPKINFSTDDNESVLRENYERIKKRNQELRKEIKKIQLSNKSLKNEIEKLKNDDINAAEMPLDKQKELLGKVFTTTQIKSFYQQKARRKVDDMCIGYTLLHMSNRRFYKYLIENLHYPFPSVSAVTKWANLKREFSEEKEDFSDSSKNNCDDDLDTIMMIQDGEKIEIIKEDVF